MRFKDQEKLKAITFSYDDGVTQDFHLIELLNKYGLKCTFNLNSELLGTFGALKRNGKNIAHYKIHPSHAQSLYKGHEVAAHTLTHPRLTELSNEEIIRQVEQDRIALSELMGYEVVGMAYPCGGVNYDDRVVDVIKNHTGIKYSRTGDQTGNFDLQDDLLRFNASVYHMDFETAMKLGQEFIDLKTEEPKIFSIFGHSYEMDYEEENWVKLEEFFKLVSGKDDIFYGTNKEVLL